MEIGIYTFAERTPDARTGHLVSAEQRLHDLLEEIELADQLGLDVFGVGEHHRPDYDLGDYDTLFIEKLELLLALRNGVEVTWSGQHRSALRGQAVYPRPLQDPLPVWIAVGGTPQSVVRAATLGLPTRTASSPTARDRRPRRPFRHIWTSWAGSDASAAGRHRRAGNSTSSAQRGAR